MTLSLDNVVRQGLMTVRVDGDGRMVHTALPGFGPLCVWLRSRSSVALPGSRCMLIDHPTQTLTLLPAS